jgi:hypothetical protein
MLDVSEAKKQCHHYNLLCTERPCPECPGLSCQTCGGELNHFDEYGIDYYYCPECNDLAYDERGRIINKII